MKLFTSPLAVRMALALFSSVFVCGVAFFLVRQLRRMFTRDESLVDAHPEPEQLRIAKV